MVETQALGAASHIIKRPRLTKILDETEARVILLCAPAGYGKTTLAREWVATRSEPVLWYAGGPAMGDVAALAVDLAELFAGPESELVERVRFLAAHGSPPKILAKAVAATAPGVVAIVVIDDWHYAAASTDADELFRELLVATAFRLVVTARMQPAWVEARQFVYGEAFALETGALAFTEEEAAAVMIDAAEVIPEARGWPAVIGLAALGGSQRAATRLAPEELYDFFAGELYDQLEPDLHLPLHLLALGADTAECIAQEVLGARCTSVITELTSRGFITQDGGIHPLLRRFLLTRLRNRKAEDISEAVHRVVRTLSNARYWDSCLTALREFPIPGLVIETLGAGLQDLLDSGRARTIHEWIEVVRLAGVAEHAVAILARAELAVREGRGSEARVLGEQAAAIATEPEFAARAHLAAARGAHLTEETQAVLDNASAGESLSSRHDLQVLAVWLAFVQTYEQQDPRTSIFCERLSQLALPGTEDTVRVASARAFLAVESTGIDEALHVITSHRPLLDRVADPLLRTNYLYMAAYLFASGAQYDSAARTASELEREAEASGVTFALDYALMTSATAFIGLRRLSDAERCLKALREREDASAHVRGNARLVACKRRIAAGDLDRAAVLLVQPPAAGTARALHGEHAAYRGLVDAARGEVAQARDALAQATRLSSYQDARILSALARAILEIQTTGDAAACVDAASTALRRGFHDTLVTACRAYPPFAAAAISDSRVRDGMTDLLMRSRDIDLGRAIGLEMPRELRRSEGLSSREREVYELVLQGRTNAEIAKTLFISQSTAKVHVRHIFEKLGVHSRAEAAASYDTVN